MITIKLSVNIRSIVVNVLLLIAGMHIGIMQSACQGTVCCKITHTQQQIRSRIDSVLLNEHQHWCSFSKTYCASYAKFWIESLVMTYFTGLWVNWVWWSFMLAWPANSCHSTDTVTILAFILMDCTRDKWTIGESTSIVPTVLLTWSTVR